MMCILYILAGLLMILWGADRFTDGAVSVARRLDVPQVVIGLTIVAFATSLPELCVSVAAALRGSNGIAVGNVVGSNIVNALLIVGALALVSPLPVARGTVRGDMPWAIGVSLLFVLLCMDGVLSLIDSILLLLVFIAFLLYTFRKARHGTAERYAVAPLSMGRSVMWLLVGVSVLILGSNLFVEGATEAARMLGVSDAVIGLTVAAAGTSLPELATSLVAAHKGQTALAIGNVLGSVIFNILLILGLTGVLHPLAPEGISLADLGLMLLSVVLLWLFSLRGGRIGRLGGLTLTLLYAGYLALLFFQAKGAIELPLPAS